MISAYLHNGVQPLADHIMDACEEWGIPPWQIDTADKMEWLNRYAIRKKYRAERLNNDTRK